MLQADNVSGGSEFGLNNADHIVQAQTTLKKNGRETRLCSQSSQNVIKIHAGADSALPRKRYPLYRPIRSRVCLTGPRQLSRGPAIGWSSSKATTMIMLVLVASTCLLVAEFN